MSLRSDPRRLGIRAVPSREALPILEALAEAIDLCGVPHELMTDNGTPFVAVLRSMLSRFQRSLAELEIRHIHIVPPRGSVPGRTAVDLSPEGVIVAAGAVPGAGGRGKSGPRALPVTYSPGDRVPRFTLA